ncbi:PepSY-associated TM helix domain-containing protein [Methylocystis bryophila]|uniref:Peptidase n=1 Tax=Methylocystis bryophila TaxID=655015 RepID=A0A1W6N209_9HYPH|nr:PepSY-associated TM helix domain-containing protein [Methylocystis bryophila]ARN83890.1 hypothetical protein B1812_21650 [Methylocystis bryophila]BDV40997.1 peptidase [Methylocystis bryophila]
MVRQLFVFIHRWAGLAMTVFLVIVALTGSVLAFREELDVWLNPELLTVAKRDTPVLDGFTLREKAAALYPDSSFDYVQLPIQPDRSVAFSHKPGMKPGDNMMEKVVNFYLDPYTGEMLGERPGWSGPTLERKNLMSFLYRLHFSLALPWSWSFGENSVGGYVLGVTALFWTIDCFIAFYLTFPLRLRSTGDVSRPAKSWWSRWKPAWLIKTNAGAYRINFDIHRAFGLWTWAMLFVFAWSSVGFNLGEVYKPTMQLLFGSRGQTMSAPAPEPAPIKRVGTPALDFREAYARGSALLHAEAGRRQLAIEQEQALSLDRDSGVYTLSARSSGDFIKSWMTYVSFDADSGDLREASFPGDLSKNTGDEITSWLIWLHMAAVFGLAMQILVCVMGLVITALCITGVYIWWKKRRARIKSRRDPAGASPAQVSRSWRSIASVAWSSATAAQRTLQSRRARH